VSFAGALGAKRLGLVLDLVRTNLIAVLVNPNFPAGLNELADLEAASEVRGQQLLVLRATNESEIEAAFANIVERRPGAVIVCADVFFVARREMIVSLAARYAMPAIYVQREYPLAGGLISYGISFADQYRQLGGYTAQVLKGARPADLPVLQPTKFELVINLNTARALGLAVPLTLQAAADEVIE
jgi:putative tryptophan/tyrosine transport system substrate-binding protein